VETGIARKSVEGNFPLSLLSEGILVGSVFDWSQKEEDVKVFLVFLLVFALFFRDYYCGKVTDTWTHS
jgi:hypothetical protein